MRNYTQYCVLRIFFLYPFLIFVLIFKEIDLLNEEYT